MYCEDNAAVCSATWWCGSKNYLNTTLLGVAVWILIFSAICLLLYPWLRGAIERRPSKYEEERGPVWFAWHVQSTIHATLVDYMVCGAVVTLSTASMPVQFEAPRSSSSSVDLDATAWIANASHVFFCFTLVDTLITFYRRQMTLDYFGHHCVFCFFCLVIQHDCFAQYLAGWLIIMEISTVFLNGFSFFRNRLGYDHLLVKLFFVFFALSFMTCRLMGTTYIAMYFSYAVLLGGLPFPGIPRWHLYLLCIALVAAVVLQFFWAQAIGNKVLKVVLGSGAPGSRTPQNPGGDALAQPLMDH